MKRIIYTFLMGLVCVFTSTGQPYDLTLSSAESGTQLHQALNSITFAAGYSYTPAGGTMLAEIVNPYVTGTVTYNSTPVEPSTRTINTSYLVGTTQGAFEVNLAGGATYTIPIDVLPGINGLAPSLSLVYSSNSGPGVAGYGWQIGGISLISRTGQNYYNDAQTRGIELDYNDRYLLDGQRLVKTSGTYGYDGATYQTENDIFTRVQSQYSSGNGPLKFMAQTKSGLKNLYGFDDDGCQRIDGFSEIINWYVTETQDLYSNVISYSYMKDNSSVYPAEITYGPNKITFYYKERTDIATTYLKGQKIRQRLLLDKITIAYNSNVVKTYEMKYNLISDNYNNYSALNEVIEYGIGSSRMNSTVFSYQTPVNVAITQAIYNTSNNYVSYKSKLFTGDFNGDGKADVFSIDNKNVNDGNYTGWKLNINQGNDNFTYSSGDFAIDESKIEDIASIDLNGDNMDDLVLKLNTGNAIDYHGNISIRYSYYYAISTGTSFGNTVFLRNTFLSLVNVNGSELNSSEQTETRDLDGDGLNDILILDQNGWDIFSFSYSNNTLNTLSLRYSGTWTNFGDKQFLVNFNGDGKAELMTVDSNGTKIYSFNGSSFTDLGITNASIPTKDHYFKVGDFNGDGKTDLFVYGYTTNDWSDWQVKLSTGTGFETIYIPQKKSNLKDDIIRTGDFNGDGCTDLMVTASNDNGWAGHYYYISKSKGSDFYSYFLQGSIAQYPSQNYFLDDFNGDGRVDYLCTDGTPDYPWNGYMIYRSTGNTMPLLEKLANGLNHHTTISYSKLSQIYTNTQATNLGFPVCDYWGPLPVVSSVTVDNGLVSGTNTINYGYEDAKIHRQGKGFLCFAKMTTEDVTSGIATEAQSGYSTTYYYPQYWSVTKKTTGGTTIETSTNGYAEKILDSATKRIFPYVSSSVQTNVLTNQSVTTTISGYDNYGNPGTAANTFKTGTTVEGSQSTAYQYLSENITNWLLGRPTKTTTTYTKGTEIVTQVVNREFSTTSNRDTAEVRYPGTDKQIRNSHVFYANGNIRKEMATSGGVLRSTSYVYNADNVRVYTKKDPLGHVTTYTYYPTNGWMQTEKDYLNNTDTYTYDNLGRVLTKTQFDGFVATNTYNWGLNTFTNSVYNLTTSGNDGSESKTWYDKLGREIRLDVKGFDDQYIYTVTNYTAAGQAQQVSEPSASANPSQWTKYEYYPEGRLKKVERHTGSITNYTYSGITATDNTDGKIRYKETNSQGLLTKAHDAGGDILYAYYPDGKVKTITAPGNAVTTMEYNDAARNQTKLIDPSAGTIQYTYDGFGQLNTQTNALGQITTSNYYADGRIDNVISPSSPVNEGTTTYSYNSNKQLIGISNPTTNVSRSYGYDTKGRVNSIGESIAGSNFSTSFTYDTKGRLDTRTHPSGIVEKMNYKTNGYFEYISVGSTTWYKVTGMNARQQITTATYGSGGTLNATYGFDTYGYPNSTVTGSVQNYGYSFEPVKGNLNWRKNVNRSNIQENFLYDSLDRLDSIYGNANSLGGVGYDFAKGNITRRTGIGKLTYNHPTIPYAITDLTAVSALYPASPDSIKQRAYYTSFNKIRLISDYPSYKADFLYNSDQQRAKMTVTQNGNNVVTRWYAGGRYMKETTPTSTKEYTYLGGDAYSAPVAAVTENGNTSYYYLLRDYLGNITHVYNASTSAVQEYSFDAWGRRRNPVTWSYDLTSQPELFAGRGFASHEHLPWFNVINMNGRLYDSILGRFLSPDQYVQMPDNTQNFNRYSYALNNPLSITDPSGEFAFIPFLAVAIWSGYFNMASHFPETNSFGEGAGNFFIGSAAGAAGAWAGGAAAAGLGLPSSFGGAIVNGAISGIAGGFAGGFVAGAGTSWLNGESFTQGFNSGISGGLTGGAIGGVLGGIWGGIQYADMVHNFNMTDDNVAMDGRKVVYNNENAKLFSDRNFGEQKGLANLYADGTFPSNADANTLGVTEPIKNGSRFSNVYLRESAFNSKWKLFNAMGHEYVHVAQIYAGLPQYVNFLESGAYSWNKFIYDFWGKPFNGEWSAQYHTSMKGVISDLKGWSGKYSLPSIDDYMWNSLSTFKWRWYPW